jgi:hypothetical protein
LTSSNHSTRKNTFQDVWNVLDVPYYNYSETCVALGFNDDDNAWDLAMTNSSAYGMPSQTSAAFVILQVFIEVGHPAGLFDKHWWAMGECFVYMLSSDEHPLADEHLMVLVLMDINRRLEARNTHDKKFNLPMPSEEELTEVEEMDRRVRRKRLPTVRRLQISGDLDH